VRKKFSRNVIDFMAICGDGDDNYLLHPTDIEKKPSDFDKIVPLTTDTEIDPSKSGDLLCLLLESISFLDIN
jgi:hypothetical protein